jgi:hypothetical protein
VLNLNQLYVAARQSEMHAQAANERLARSLRTRSAKPASVKAVWSFLGGTAEPLTLPNLTNYPYRG